MEITDIELEPLSPEHPGSPSRPTGSRTLTGWLAIGLAVAATGALGVLIVRNDAGTQASTDEPRLEQSAAILPAAVDIPPSVVAVERYRACLPDGGGSADALERWVMGCRRELEQMLFSGDSADLCVPQGAGSADGLERWVENCRRDVEGELLSGGDAEIGRIQP